MKSIVLIALVSGATILGGNRALSASAQDAAKIEAGKAAYATQKCATCHAIKAVGGKMATALDGVGTRLSEADLKKWFVTPAEMEAKLPKKPAAPMSTFLKSHKLTDADVDALVAYMVSLK